MRMGQTGNLNIPLRRRAKKKGKKKEGEVIRACYWLPQGEQIGSKTLIDIIFKRAFFINER